MKQFVKKVPILASVAVWLHRYIRSRQGISRLKRLPKDSPIRLIIGASGICGPGWIGTDVEYLNLLRPEHWKAYFQKNSIDTILAEHVWEHLTAEEGLVGSQRCFEYIKPGGYLRVAVPDGFHPDEEYINYVKPGGTGAGATDHKILYNHITFARIFEKAGFRVRLLEYFDSEGKFHSENWNPEDGKIYRSRRFDKRNENGKLGYTSIILDACKDTLQTGDGSTS